jgi:YfiH family protein
MLLSPLLAAVEGIEHGFGTRHSPRSQDAMASLTQRHSNRVLAASRPGLQGEADALVTATQGVAVSVRTADCIPILLADRRTGAVAAVHAGWRGTAARIAVETLARMRGEFGTRPEDVVAAIGPGIGECCYEVGIEVARQFGESGPRLNLAAHNLRQLEAAGVRKIDVVSPCTFCDGRFFSYRREGERAGRMISFIRRVRA